MGAFMTLHKIKEPVYRLKYLRHCTKISPLSDLERVDTFNLELYLGFLDRRNEISSFHLNTLTTICREKTIYQWI